LGNDVLAEAGRYDSIGVDVVVDGTLFHDFRDFRGAEVFTTVDKERVTGREVGMTNVVTEHGYTADIVGTAVGVGGDRDGLTIIDRILAVVQRGCNVSGLRLPRPCMGGCGRVGDGLVGCERWREPNDRGARAEIAILLVVMGGIKELARADGESMAGDEGGFEDATQCSASILLVDVYKAPHDEREGEGNASGSPLGMYKLVLACEGSTHCEVPTGASIIAHVPYVHALEHFQYMTDIPVGDIRGELAVRVLDSIDEETLKQVGPR
jgi:hypothetical protein